MAFEPLFCAWQSSRVIHDDDDLLVVDKPSGIAVHGGDQAHADDVVSRLARWLRDRGRDAYLGVHQRLDKGTSGVLLFTRRDGVNSAVARDVETHAFERVYVAAIDVNARTRLADHGRLEDQLRVVAGKRTELVKSGGKPAITDYRLVERRGKRALVELRPRTGRTHQLRVQLASRGAPIAGDRLYGGSPAPRLMLHAERLRVPSLSREFAAFRPCEFDAWLRGSPSELPDAEALYRRLLDAGSLRYALRDEASAFRVVNGAGDLLPGITVDRYGDFAVLSLSNQAASDRRTEIASSLLRAGARGVYSKSRARADLRRAQQRELAPPHPIAGSEAPPELIVTESDMRFAVALGDGLSTGLFVDQRDNRARVRALAPHKRVLNLFSYTCSFSVAAALGGAVSTLSVDLSARALERGRRNFELNGIVGEHRFYKEDALAWLERAARRGQRFDLIVLDPPSFATVGKDRTFSVEHDYESLLERALRLLAPGGTLLAVTNHRKTEQHDLRKLVHRALAAIERRSLSLKDLPSGLDCPPGENGPEPSKSVLVTVE